MVFIPHFFSRKLKHYTMRLGHVVLFLQACMPCVRLIICLILCFWTHKIPSEVIAFIIPIFFSIPIYYAEISIWLALLVFCVLLSPDEDEENPNRNRNRLEDAYELFLMQNENPGPFQLVRFALWVLTMDNGYWVSISNCFENLQ